jgi:hypothetical protein
VVIGKTEDKARKICAWAVGGNVADPVYLKNLLIEGNKVVVNAEALWPGCKKANPKRDVVLIPCMEATDLTGIDDLVKYYMCVPVKFIVYDGAAPQPEREKEWSAACFPIESSEALMVKLQKAHDELVKLIKNVFDHFDHDKSGFIDLKELTEVAKELGVVLPAAEAEMLYKELDTNKDGKISFQEFTEWWRNGRLGKTYKLSEMVTRGIHKSQSLSIAADILDKFGGLKELKEGEEKVVNSQLDIHINKVTTTGGIIVHGMLMSKGKALDAHIQEYKTVLPFDSTSTFMALSFGCKKDPKQVAATIKSLFWEYGVIEDCKREHPNPKKLEEQFKIFNCGATANGKAVLGFELPADDMVMRMIMGTVGKAFPPGIEQNCDIFVKLATDFAKLVTEDRSAIDLILDGLSANLSLHICHSTASKMAMIASMSDKVPPQFGFLANIVQENGMYANTLNAEVELEADKELRAKALAMIPPGHPATMPLKNLKQMIAPMAKDFMVKYPILVKVKDFLQNDIDSLEIFACSKGNLAAKVNIELPGLSTFVEF